MHTDDFRYNYNGKPYVQLRDIFNDLEANALFKLFQDYYLEQRNIDLARANAELMHESQNTFKQRKSWTEIAASFESTLFDVARLNVADEISLQSQINRKESKPISGHDDTRESKSSTNISQVKIS